MSVYKLTFNDGSFYYGSTKLTMEARMKNHMHMARDYRYKNNKFMMKLLLETPSIHSFQCSEPKIMENELICSNLSNPLCLNSNRVFQTKEQNVERVRLFLKSRRELGKIDCELCHTQHRYGLHSQSFQGITHTCDTCKMTMSITRKNYHEKGLLHLKNIAEKVQKEFREYKINGKL